MSKNLSELSGKKGLKENLFNKLGELALETGTPNKEDLEQLAKDFLMGKGSSTYGTASFYDFLKPENKGKTVYVCNGTACLCAGTQDLLSQKLRKHFAEEEIGHMTCLGRCHENSAFHYGGKNYSGSAINDLEVIKGNAGTQNRDSYNVQAIGPQILTRPFTDLETYYAPFLSALKRGSEAVLEEIKVSGIRGRGGAGFPMGMKLEFCRNEVADTKFIICNADEGDPGAYSDRYLLEQRPHSVLFGMMISGFVTHANHGV
ncbi:MAG: NAD(P)H-dependent oxidoreductase subunit E, partial [Bacteroidetes bacterium]|nr:NAD(P)H-dependent oxidoreductase subunit E [Bacteroidota bacterium]